MTDTDRYVTLQIDREEVADVLAFMKIKHQRLGKVVEQMSKFGIKIESVQNKWTRCVLDYTRNLGNFMEHGKCDKLDAEIDECVALQEGWDG